MIFFQTSTVWSWRISVFAIIVINYCFSFPPMNSSLAWIFSPFANTISWLRPRFLSDIQKFKWQIEKNYTWPKYTACNFKQLFWKAYITLLRSRTCQFSAQLLNSDWSIYFSAWWSSCSYWLAPVSMAANHPWPFSWTAIGWPSRQHVRTQSFWLP